ncbi:MATE family efflux transporter [Sphingomicrobium nitratireducens]|uniref:MATE family efflux transporter n=1 Tax=Sphingomicrobium nitratireducens TaxID=2964666 RepID=UPI0022405102|nr:MATE family efflux transporter [Sphingomicrobium nitratireducens]
MTTIRHGIDTRIIWAIAIPAMLTNVATALIGIGDMWIVGRLEDAATQGAVDVGARLFALLFTVMNFLKTGTTGLVAQGGTRHGVHAQAETLVRGLVIGFGIAAALLLAKPVLQPLLLSALGAQGDVLAAARVYADIRYFTAPGVMANLALVGFLVGRRQVRTAMAVEIGYNLLNVGLGLWFVLGLDMGIAGIGWSSFAAEYAKLALLALLVLRGAAGGEVLAALRNRSVIAWASLRPFLSINRDLFLRTVILMIAGAALTRIGAERGAVTLAANGILYQLFVFMALLLDGFENAAQVLNGERYGAHDRVGFLRVTKAILWRGFAVAFLLAAAFLVTAGPVIVSFAATPAVAIAAFKVAPWMVLIPLAGVASFVFDGVFVGASWTRALLLSMAGAALVYALAIWATWSMGNQGLWASFALFLVARAALQALMLPRLAEGIADERR